MIFDVDEVRVALNSSGVNDQWSRTSSSGNYYLCYLEFWLEPPMPMTYVECRDATEAPFLVHHEIEDDSGFHSNLGFSTTTSRGGRPSNTVRLLDSDQTVKFLTGIFCLR
jgi:hypothetical protein